MKSLPLAFLFVIPVFLGFTSPLQPQDGNDRFTRYNGEVPLLIYFKSNDCTTCGPFDELFEQYVTRARIEQHYNAVCLNVDQSEGQICAEIYDVTSTPVLVIADRTGHVVYRSTTTLTEDEVKLILETLPGHPAAIEESNMKDEPVKLVISAPKENTVVSEDSIQQQPFRNSETHISKTGLSVRSSNASPGLTATTDLKVVPASEFKRTIEPRPVFAGGEGWHVFEIGKSDPEPLFVEVSEAEPETKAEPTVPKVNSRKWNYAIQLGFFSTRPNAMKLIDKADAVGLPDLRTEDTHRDGQEFFRVLSGTYQTLQEAQDQLDSAISMGFKAAIYRW